MVRMGPRLLDWASTSQLVPLLKVRSTPCMLAYFVKTLQYKKIMCLYNSCLISWWYPHFLSIRQSTRRRRRWRIQCGSRCCTSHSHTSCPRVGASDRSLPPIVQERYVCVCMFRLFFCLCVCTYVYELYICMHVMFVCMCLHVDIMCVSVHDMICVCT